MTTLALKSAHITLANAVKIAGFADSGGQAKHLVRGGDVRVNDAVEIRPGRKLVAGDRFQVGAAVEWRVAAAE